MKKMELVNLIAFTAFGILFAVFGFSGDGYLHKACLLFGGLYIGNVLTEALNYDERDGD
jgi:hypothetical protein